jgi:hypothetical protein
MYLSLINASHEDQKSSSKEGPSTTKQITTVKVKQFSSFGSENFLSGLATPSGLHALLPLFII